MPPEPAVAIHEQKPIHPGQPQFTIMDNSVLSQIVRIIVEIADPDSIILFGSRAKETAQDDSDYDICILKSGIVERRKLSMQLYQKLWVVDAPVDILVETPDSFNMNKSNPHLIYRKIAEQGTTVYAKAG